MNKIEERETLEQLKEAYQYLMTTNQIDIFEQEALLNEIERLERQVDR